MAMRKSRLTIAPKLKALAVRRRGTPDATSLAAPKPMPEDAARDPLAGTKVDQTVVLLSRPEGATIAQMMELTGWKARSVRGFMAGALKAKRGIVVTSSKADGVRTYRISGVT